MLIVPQTYFLDIPILNADGTHKIAVHEWGNANAEETVFCVHGLTRNGRDFDVLASSLCDSYRVIAVDMVGRGKSQWHTDHAHYNYVDYVADIAHIFTQLKLIKTHWIGTSMGGIIGMMVANSFPQFLKTLTINDIGCLVPAAGLKRIAEYVSTNNFKTRAEAEAALCSRCAAYGIQAEEHWQNLFVHSIEETGDCCFRLAYDPAIAQGFVKNDDVKDIDLWSLWEMVKKIPTLLIRGDKSDILPAGVAKKMQETHPNLQLLTVPDVGHAPALMDDAQITTIAGFLKASAQTV